MSEKARGKTKVRHLVLVLGDQLDADSAAFDGFDKERDAVWMAEVDAEATHVWSHKARIAIFLAAMRHFRDELRDRGMAVRYSAIDDDDNRGDFAGELERAVEADKPERLIVVGPGEHRVREALLDAADGMGVPLDVRTDRHFYCTTEDFREHAEGRKQLRMEYFYREMRKRTGVLTDDDGKPAGGQWNFDKDNRETFGKDGPPLRSSSFRIEPNDLTREVLDLVNDRFAEHPGSLDKFDWPVTREQALEALDDFIAHRLPSFGDYQDAMWTGEPYLFHARLSSSLNLKLLNPREVVAAAEAAYDRGDAPLNAVEGFIRQILGWREYVRGIYWLYMPQYIERNTLDADGDLPDFYWTGDTDMNCLREAIGQTLEHGYAHHIQRLMVTGLFAMLLGVDPHRVHEWYLAVYVDAVEWVELPNTLGMSQYADDGLMASKPYAASGKYIQRMSNYCNGCRYHPAEAAGDDACPFTTLYWDFLDRHRDTLEDNRRMKLQVKNLDRKDADEMKAIRKRATSLRRNPDGQ